jgi:hypothetical protein
VKPVLSTALQYLKKVQRQERIVEEVKLVLKPAYNTRRITKEAYKEIQRKTVPKVILDARFSILDLDADARW